MVRPITELDLGLRELYDGTSSTAHPGAPGPVDIVAVHGMGAHPDDTWCHQVPGEDGPAYVNWLKDERFLPASVPRARIMRYGYSSQWFGEDATKTKISDISQAFLFDLDEFREDKNRPLILIGHSFGGLVLLKTMVDADLERKRWPGIYDSTVGLVFFGTPFRGTHDSLSQGEILRRALQHFAAENRVYEENLGILRAGGEQLIDLVDTYLRVARNSPMPRVACFYEQKASEVGRILGRDVGKAIQPVILVDETSGSLDLNERSDKYALPRTHFNIHRFGSPIEQAFRQVRSVIRKMVNEGPELVATRCGPKKTDSDPKEKESSPEEKEECMQSLCFPNIDARRQDIASAYPKTCDWLFRTAEFRRWHDRTDIPNNRGVLWVNGKPGAGKSTLMKHTLGHCQQTLKGYTIAAYFFNARGVDLEKTPCGMLRSLVHQLVTQEPAAFRRFLPIFRNKQRMHGATWEWRESELKEFLLSEIRNGQPKPLLLLVDALDECSEPHVRDVVGYLERLSVAAMKTRILSICLSSRHYPHISMRKFQEIIVEHSREHVKDIATYVRGTLIEPDRGVERDLLDRASGVFMWVVLVVGLLNIAYDEGKVEAMHRTLREVPSDLDDLFRTLLSKDKPDKNETILMLQWVLFAKESLTAEELFHATLAGTNAESLDALDPSRMTPDRIRRRITNSSRGLIEVRKYQGTVQFVHETVNDFLLRNRRLQTLDAALELNPIGISYSRLSTCCVSYLVRAAPRVIRAAPYVIRASPQSPGGTTRIRTITRYPVTRYPFTGYAIKYFLDHAEEAEAAHVGQGEALRQLTESHNAMELIEECNNCIEPNIRKCSKTATLLYLVAIKGYKRVAKTLLEQGGDVDCQHESCGTPLQAAAYAGNTEMVTLLLEHGADINAQGGLYDTPLQMATYAGKTEVVALLLKNGADANA